MRYWSDTGCSITANIITLVQCAYQNHMGQECANDLVNICTFVANVGFMNE